MGILVYLLIPSVLLSLSAQASNTLTWNQCLKEALENNPSLAAAREKKSAADFSVSSARSGYFPQISGSLSYSRGNSATAGSSTTSTSGLTSNSDSVNDSYAATLSLSQNLFSGLQDKAKVDQAKAQLDSADAAVIAAEAKVVADLKVAFANLAYAQASHELQERIIKRRKENYNLIQLRFKSGRENRGSVLLAQAYTDQAVLDALTAVNSIESARADLARVLGREPEDFIVQGEVPLVSIPNAPPDFRKLASESPDIRQSFADVRVAEASLVTARSGFFPTLALNASAGEQGREWFPDRDRWSVGATLTIPLFNGGKDYYGSRSASSSLMAARATLDNVTRDKVTKLRTAFFAYQEGHQKVKVDDGFRDAAALRAEIARAKYNNGLMTFDDWDVVENDLITREKAMLQTRRDLVRLESEWLSTQGKGNSDAK